MIFNRLISILAAIRGFESSISLNAFFVITNRTESSLVLQVAVRGAESIYDISPIMALAPIVASNDSLLSFVFLTIATLPDIII